jgi:hypothetical protein
MGADDLNQLRAAAQAGDARALGVLGRRLVLGEGPRPSPAEGVEFLKQAHARGDAEAAALLARFAAWGVMREPNHADALDLLVAAAQRGWAPAQEELRFLARANGSDWAALRNNIDLAGLCASPAKHAISETPRVRYIERFATPAECDRLIALARGALHRAQVYHGSAELKLSDVRTNSEAAFIISYADVALSLIRQRISAALGISHLYFEVAKLLHYEVGQQFGVHGDFLELTTPEQRAEVERRGQRAATFLIYLNDDFEGGETDFPRLGLRHKPKRGDALAFANVTSTGAPDYESVHAGLPPTRGEKWLFSQWIRSNPVNAFATPGPLPGELDLAWRDRF